MSKLLLLNVTRGLANARPLFDLVTPGLGSVLVISRPVRLVLGVFSMMSDLSNFDKQDVRRDFLARIILVPVKKKIRMHSSKPELLTFNK